LLKNFAHQNLRKFTESSIIATVGQTNHGQSPATKMGETAIAAPPIT
jgi:hypothetical protein